MEASVVDPVVKALRDLAPHLNPPIANPTPLGLFAFAITTALLMCWHTRLTGLSTASEIGTEHMVWGFALFNGGLAQLIAGILEYYRNNVFALTAFVMFGSFWMSLGTVGIISSVAGYFNDGTNTFVFLYPIDPEAEQAILCFWGLFTSVMFICTLVINVTISALFFFLALAFFLLAGGVKDENVDRAGGWAGMIAAGLAFWLASLEIINDVVGGGKEVISPGHWPWKRDQFRGGAFHVAGRIHAPHHHSALYGAGFEEEVKHRLVHLSSITPAEKKNAVSVDQNAAQVAAHVGEYLGRGL